MADEANEDADKASWTIKSVPVETRKLAVACASRAGETMAEWLVKAVRNQANLEAGERVLPPARSAASLPARPAYALPPPDLGELAGLMDAARTIAAAADVPIPKATARHALALMQAQLRAARGLPPLARRQTRPKNGQTIDGAAETATAMEDPIHA